LAIELALNGIGPTASGFEQWKSLGLIGWM